MSSYTDLITEFCECLIHTTLYTRCIYPKNLFDIRKLYGIAVWQTRHPDINTYIRRVLNNANPLVEQNLLQELIFRISNKDNIPIDDLHIKLSIDVKKLNTINNDLIAILQDEFRSVILRTAMLNEQIGYAPKDCNWAIIAVTKPVIDEANSEIIQQSLTSGEWYADNFQPSIEDENLSIIPIRYFNTNGVNLEVVCKTPKKIPAFMSES
eukprot:gene6410-8823_t